MFAFQRPSTYVPSAYAFPTPYNYPPPLRQLSRVEILRAELARAEQEVAFARQKRFDDILEEERMRAHARRLIEEEQEEARLVAALARKKQEQAARLVAERRQLEEQKHAVFAKMLREERMKLCQAEKKKMLEQVFGSDEVEPTAPTRAPKRKAVHQDNCPQLHPTLKTTASPRKAENVPRTVVFDFSQLLDTPPTATQPPKVAAKLSVESRPDLAQQAEKPTENVEQPEPNLAASRSAIQKVASAFDTLAVEFLLPTALDFTPPSSRNPSLAASDSEGASSSISRLAYTPANAPVRIFENTASRFLNELDAIESYGDADLRKERKAVVERIENKLAEVDREVNRLWRGWSEAKVQVEAVMATPAVSVDESSRAADPIPAPDTAEEPKVSLEEEPSLTTTPTEEADSSFVTSDLESTITPSYMIATTEATPAAESGKTEPTDEPVDDHSDSESDTYLSSLAGAEVQAKKPRHDDGDSDWFEVEA